MATDPSWVPDHVDPDIPSAARIYDFLLGGAHNFAVDRMVGAKILNILPDGRQVARSNRAYLGRAVRYLVDQGITQFLDLGSGIPTVGNVHEVAQHANPDCRVVYVDRDEVAVAHSELLLAGNPRATVVCADITRPGSLLNMPQVRRLIDFEQPLGLLMVAIFHFVPDEQDPREILARYISALPSGSHVALSHLTADQHPQQMARVVEAMRISRDPMYFRSLDYVKSLFDGLELVDPGVVGATEWRPEDGMDCQQQPGVWVGVARKP